MEFICCNQTLGFIFFNDSYNTGTKASPRCYWGKEKTVFSPAFDISIPYLQEKGTEA